MKATALPSKNGSYPMKNSRNDTVSEYEMRLAVSRKRKVPDWIKANLNLSAAFVAIAMALVAAGAVSAQGLHGAPAQTRAVDLEELRNTISSLTGSVPLDRDVSDYIADKLAAQQLGKALFWDTQVGSDGGACASCHFSAGADLRITNQVNPGLKGNDTKFDLRGSGAGLSGPNKTLTSKDFPFHRLANPNDRESNIDFDTNDVFSSQGTFGGTFLSNSVEIATRGQDGMPSNLHKVSQNSIQGNQFPSLSRKGSNDDPDSAQKPNENCSNPYDPPNNPWHSNNHIFRKVEPRNTPTIINAVFNYRQFWDGRANNQFNGVDPFGPRTFKPQIDGKGPGNPNAASSGTLVYDPDAPGGSPKLQLKQILIANSSLASQSVGPALSNFEMSCANKTFQNLGRKLLKLRPLASQRVSPEDSLFSQTSSLLSSQGQKGLNATYQSLVEKAFKPKYRSATGRVSITPTGQIVVDSNGFSQIEQNFSLFWGLAVQEYMSLLISDDSPFDRAMNGNLDAMSDRAKAGEILFLNKGACANCHFGPAFSAAAFTKTDRAAPKVLEHMEMNDGYNAFYDAGFYNIGVRPTIEDIGVGGQDPYGFDLSLSRGLKWKQLSKPERAPDSFDPTPCSWLVQFSPCSNVPAWTDPLVSERDNVDGSFKIPSLRNVGLTPPYFHNGGESNLRDVLHFYSRGGNRRGPVEADTTGLPTPTPFGQINKTNLDPDIGVELTAIPEQHNALLLTEAEIDDLVQFLLSLTDQRVACQSDVFDHPELPVYMGQSEEATNSPKAAKDIIRILPAVGKRGLKSIGKPCQPNSGDLFSSVNLEDPTPLQSTLAKILDTEESAKAADYAQSGSTTLANFNPSSGFPSVSPSVTNNRFTAPSAPLSGGGGLPSATKAGTAKPLVATPANPILTASVAVPPAPPVPTPLFSAALDDIHGFTSIGFIQGATLSDALCQPPPQVPPLPRLPKSQWGGTAVINDVPIIIPCNSVIQMPAATFTWADLFDPAKFVSTQSPPALLTLDPPPAPLNKGEFQFPSTEIRVEGNIVAGKHIAGLVYISQQSLNSGTGFITDFDYANGVIYVGRTLGGPAMARLQLNDPKITDQSDPGTVGTGRFSAGQTPDSRFSVDPQNPTIHAFTGYPMCVPRADPAVDPTKEADPLCPQQNRPLAAAGCRNFVDAGFTLPTGRVLAAPGPGAKYCSGFVMKAPPGTPPTFQLNGFIAAPGEPDARQQAPFEVGDLITWNGTLLKGDGKGPNNSDTIAAHTITANVGIFTQPGTLPSYVSIGDFRVGTSPPVLFFKGIVLPEIDRIILEAFTTDLFSILDIYLVDIDPKTGEENQRWITPGTMTGNAGAVGSNNLIIDGGIVTQFFGAQPGRARLRATHAVTGILESPTRYVRVAVRSLCDPANINGTAPQLGTSTPAACLKRAPAANGLYSGQYLAPTFNFIFPENIVPGDPQVPKNFWDLNFLASGEGKGTGPLTPTPW